MMVLGTCVGTVESFFDRAPKKGLSHLLIQSASSTMMLVLITDQANC